MAGGRGSWGRPRLVLSEAAPAGTETPAGARLSGVGLPLLVGLDELLQLLEVVKDGTGFHAPE